MRKQSSIRNHYIHEIHRIPSTEIHIKIDPETSSECIWSLHKLKADLNKTPKRSSPTEDELIIKNYKPSKKNPHEKKLKATANQRIHIVKTGNNSTVLKGN